MNENSMYIPKFYVIYFEMHNVMEIYISFCSGSILILDSIGGYHQMAVKLIKDYLTEERRKKRNVICRDYEIVIVDVPKQNNSYDCGVYMLKYAENFCLVIWFAHFILSLKLF